MNFVLIRTREPWLTQAVTGIAYRGEMCEGVLTELRKQISSEEHRLRTGAPPATSPGDNENEANDPMDDMEVEDDASDQKGRKVRSNCRQRRFPFEKQAFTVFVREVHPEITRGGVDDTKKRPVVVYLAGKKQVWIHIDDLDWLVQSLWIQQKVRRVAVDASGDEGPDAHVGMAADMTPEKPPQPEIIK